MVYKGVKRARSLVDLDDQLLRDQIGLMNASIKNPYFKTVPVSMKVHFFKHLAMLVEAGIYMDQALAILSKQTQHQTFKELIEDMSSEVQHGSSIAQALSICELFDPIVIQMIQAGHESGNLAKALESIGLFMESKDEFQKKLRQAAILPIITLAVFTIVALVILIGIIPAISTFFASAGKDLPAITRAILYLSESLRSWQGACFVAAIPFCFVAVRVTVKKLFATINDRFLLAIPLVGSFIRTSTLAYYSQALGLLLEGKITTISALKTARDSIQNKAVQDKLALIEQLVERGQPLHSAMQETNLFSMDICQMVAVAEKAGTVARMMNKIRTYYHQEMAKRLTIATSLLQPALMILLALMIVGLIVAVYLPLFDLSMVIT